LVNWKDFCNRILKTEYDSDFAFLKNKSYFIQLFQKKKIYILFNFF